MDTAATAPTTATPAAAAAPAPSVSAQPATASPAAPPASSVAAPTSHRSVAPLLAFAAAGAVVVLYIAQRTIGAVPLAPSQNGLQNLTLVLAPLIATAAFIERAVEVVITSWRDAGAAILQQNVQNNTGETAAAWQRELRLYKLRTQRYAFLTSLTVSFFAALVGVRAVSPLLDLGAFSTAPAGQQAWFGVFDVVVTALLLAGGADGVHQVTTTITGFLDKTKQGTAPGGGRS